MMRTSLLLFLCVAVVRAQCPVGHGSTPCTPCALGRFSGQEAASGGLCEECAPGYHAPVIGMSQCLACPAGTQQPNPGKAECFACTAGRFSTGVAPERCISCDPINVAPSERMTSCIACPAGQIPDAQRRHCVTCEPGTFRRLFDPAGGCRVCPDAPVSGEDELNKQCASSWNTSEIVMQQLAQITVLTEHCTTPCESTASGNTGLSAWGAVSIVIVCILFVAGVVAAALRGKELCTTCREQCAGRDAGDGTSREQLVKNRAANDSASATVAIRPPQQPREPNHRYEIGEDDVRFPTDDEEDRDEVEEVEMSSASDGGHDEDEDEQAISLEEASHPVMELHLEENHDATIPKTGTGSENATVPILP